MGAVKLLIANQAPIRLGIRMALNGEVEICAEAETAEQAIRAAKRHQPDLCLIGREICGERMGSVLGISRAAPHAAVVVLAPVADEDDLLDAIRAGAIGYVPEGLDAAQLRRVVRAVVAKEAVVPRTMVLELVMELRGGGGDSLTGRESQVLGMLRRGHSTAAIADRLQIAPVTVRRHISELVHKLGVEDRSALIGGSWWREPAGASIRKGPHTRRRQAAQALNGKPRKR
jgi:DNA-binding NarL/FixJ family response regulator